MGPQHPERTSSVAPSSTKLSTRARIGIGVGAGLIAILAAAYVGGHFLAGDRLPTKASVAGIPVGGLSPADAEQKLRTGLAERSGQQLAITAGSQTLSVAPAEAGLSVDYAASIAQAGGGGTWNPADILTVLFGGSPHQAVVAVDQQKLDAAVASLAAKVDVAPVDAEVAYAGLKPVRTVSKDGVALDRAATAAEVTAAFLNQVEVTAVVGVAEPVVTTAEADQVVTGIAADRRRRTRGHRRGRPRHDPAACVGDRRQPRVRAAGRGPVAGVRHRPASPGAVTLGKAWPRRPGRR